MTQRKALVVDDSKSARFALRRFLEGREFDVDTAESASEAYKYLAQQLPAVIFLDHSMPGTDGFDVLREIKGDPRTDSIPVVICSSNEAEDFQSQAVERGAAGVLPKPPTATQLERILGGLQAFAQQLREDHAPDSERVTTLHRAADQVQAEQAIESAVLRVVKGAVPQNGESLDERLDSLSTQIARRLNHVGDTVSQQMTALRERLDKLEQGNGATPDSIRDLAREETDALRMTLQKQLSELRDEIAELRKDLKLGPPPPPPEGGVAGDPTASKRQRGSEPQGAPEKKQKTEDNQAAPTENERLLVTPKKKKKKKKEADESLNSGSESPPGTDQGCL